MELLFDDITLFVPADVWAVIAKVSSRAYWRLRVVCRAIRKSVDGGFPVLKARQQFIRFVSTDMESHYVLPNGKLTGNRMRKEYDDSYYTNFYLDGVGIRKLEYESNGTLALIKVSNYMEWTVTHTHHHHIREFDCEYHGIRYRIKITDSVNLATNIPAHFVSLSASIGYSAVYEHDQDGKYELVVNKGFRVPSQSSVSIRSRFFEALVETFGDPQLAIS